MWIRSISQNQDSKSDGIRAMLPNYRAPVAPFSMKDWYSPQHSEKGPRPRVPSCEKSLDRVDFSPPYVPVDRKTGKI
jgi:hypothetical protein